MDMINNTFEGVHNKILRAINHQNTPNKLEFNHMKIQML